MSTANRARLTAAALAIGLATTLSLACGTAVLDGGGDGPAEEAAATARAPAATTVFLVRHGEALYPPPADAPRNPPLNRLGRARAAALADVLRDAGVSAIFSTDLRRTLETATPLAERLGLAIQIYDHQALAELAERLAATPGRFLISGHSNTTPEMVRLLGGEPGEPIDEKVEFDRLYVVTLGAGGTSTVLLRYGEPPGSWPPADPAALAEP